jgi:hypothetical protein
MKKLFIIPILFLFLTACTAPKMTIQEIKNDKNLGKTITAEGGVISYSLDSNKKGILKIQDETGAIYIFGDSSLFGAFGAYYDNSSGQAAQYYVDKATGILKKGQIGNDNDYYLYVNDAANVMVREQSPARVLVPVDQGTGGTGSVNCYWKGLQKFCN